MRPVQVVYTELLRHISTRRHPLRPRPLGSLWRISRLWPVLRGIPVKRNNLKQLQFRAGILHQCDKQDGFLLPGMLVLSGILLGFFCVMMLVLITMIIIVTPLICRRAARTIPGLTPRFWFGAWKRDMQEQTWGSAVIRSCRLQSSGQWQNVQYHDHHQTNKESISFGTI